MNKKTADNLLKLVANNYQTIAEDFDLTRQKPAWPEITKLAADINDSFKRQNVLDVGCGNGRLFTLFQGRNINYLGVDNCRALIDLAKQNYRASFTHGDILTLNLLKEHNFDYVFCIAVLHHLPGNKLRLEALKQLKSKIKPQGIIIVSVWNLWSQKKYRRLVVKFWLLKMLGKNRMDFGDILFDWQNTPHHPNSQRYYHAFTKRQLIKLSKQAGLKIQRLYKDKFNYYLIMQK